jgi:hypothetical protein
MMIGLMKRVAHAISGIGEKPALLTEGGLLRCVQRQPIRGSLGPGSCQLVERTPRYVRFTVRRASFRFAPIPAIHTASTQFLKADVRSGHGLNQRS